MQECADGNLEVVKELLRDQKDINKLHTYYGTTALLSACRRGRLEVVKELLKHPDIDVNKPNERGFSPLFHAALRDDILIMRELLGHTKINVNWASSDTGVTVLHRVLSCGNLETLKELLEHADKISFNLRDNRGRTPLFTACEVWPSSFDRINGNILELLKYSDKIDVNIPSEEYGDTPLKETCLKGNFLVFQALLGCTGIDINIPNCAGFTALMTAAARDNYDITRELLIRSGIINLKFPENKQDSRYKPFLMKMKKMMIIVCASQNPRIGRKSQMRKLSVDLVRLVCKRYFSFNRF